MRDGFLYSVVFHVLVVAVSYFGLPYISRAPVMVDAPIMVDIVNVDEVTNAPPPKPKAEEKKKPEPEKKKAPPPPKPPRQASPPPPPVTKDPEVAALPPEPEPKKKEQKKEEPKKVDDVKPKPEPKLIRAKPRRKPTPPDAFASVLKTVEKLKEQPQPKEKEEKKKKKKEPEKTENFDQLMAKAITSKTSRHDPSQPLAISEIDLVRQQIFKCWNVPAGAKGAENLSIDIRMVMNPDGTVRDARIQDQARLHSDPFFRAAAESALRAVLNPRCNPLKLPREKYAQWQTMTLIFDPSHMF